MEFHELTILAICGVIHGGIECRNHVTRLAECSLTGDRTTPAKPTRESIVIAVVVVGSITKLVAKVLASWLVVETQERSKLPISATGSIAHVVVQDIHGPLVGVH